MSPPKVAITLTVMTLRKVLSLNLTSIVKKLNRQKAKNRMLSRFRKKRNYNCRFGVFKTGF